MKYKVHNKGNQGYWLGEGGTGSVRIVRLGLSENTILEQTLWDHQGSGHAGICGKNIQVKRTALH